MNIQAIIFDLDGTLLNTLIDIAETMNDVLASEGFPTHPVEDYKILVGGGMRNLTRLCLPQDAASDEQVVDRCLQKMKSNYSERWDHKTHPYEGIPELLETLAEKNIPLAVLSNKPHIYTCQLIEKFFSNIPFQKVYGPQEGIDPKPDPTMALRIAQELNVPAENCAFVGDSNVDMMTAKNAGMQAIAVLWGFRQEKELRASGAKHLLKTPEDLLNL